MKIDVLWDNIKILNIIKESGYYISYVYKDNIKEVRKLGFPIFFLKEINIVSDELPAIVRQRISNINNLKGKLKFKDNLDEYNVEENICKYINETGCRRPTDKFSIKIEV